MFSEVQPTIIRHNSKRTSEQMRGGREHLTPAEMDKLLTAAKESKLNGCRNHALLLMMYRHGLRVSEAIALKWASIDFECATVWIKRSKGSLSGVHPLAGTELRVLRNLKKLTKHSPYLFLSSEGMPITDHAIRKLVERLGKKVGMEIPIHPHMLRHSCGYKLTNDGQDLRAIQAWLGHKSIQNTTRYTALAPNRFNGFWE